MRICIVAPTAHTILPQSTAQMAGGAEMQLRHLGRGFVQRGADVTFIVGEVGQRAVEHVDGMKVLRCPFRYYGSSWRHFVSDTRHLVSLVRGLSPDVILFKTPRTLAFSLSLVKAGGATKVVRIMAHDSDCDRQFVPVTNVLYLLGARRMDGTVFQSYAQALLAQRRFGIRGRMIPNISHSGGFSHATIVADCDVGHERDIDCLWVGTCDANKLPLEFLKVVRAFPERRFTMIMAPSSDRALWQTIASQAAELKNLDFRGFVRYEETQEFFRRSRLLVHTSLREGFPNVFLQAWECGTPVVSMHVDPDGVIARNELGRVSGSISGVIKDVGELLGDENRRSAFGEGCTAYLTRTHAPHVVVEQYVEYFRELGVHGASLASLARGIT